MSVVIFGSENSGKTLLYLQLIDKFERVFLCSDYPGDHQLSLKSYQVPPEIFQQKPNHFEAKEYEKRGILADIKNHTSPFDLQYDCAVLMYDQTNLRSQDNFNVYQEEIKRNWGNIPVMVLGIKRDREVDKNDLRYLHEGHDISLKDVIVSLKNLTN